MVPDADVIVPARFRLDAALLGRAKRCRLIQQMGAGVDMVDLDAAESLGIPVSNAPGDQTGGADSVAEMALWLLIACRRRLPELTRVLRSGDWSTVPVAAALRGATVCILGYGAIGSRLGELLRALSCRVLAVKRSWAEEAPAGIEPGTPAELPRFLGEADAVVLALPLSEATRGLVDAAFLARMPAGSVLVNVSGDAVDKLVADFPYYRKATIPGGMYRGTDADVQTFGVGATLVTSAAVSEDVVYALVKAVFSDMDQFRGLHPAFANLDPKEMANDGLSAPLHPGAEKYYREVGLIE